MRAGCIAVCSLLLAACQLAPAGRPLATARRPGTPAPRATATPTAPAPSQAPAGPTPAPRVSLGPPAPDAVPLVGTLRIDAGYVVGSRLGKLLSDNGGSVLLVGDALLSNNGSSLVANNGGSLVGNHAASYRLAATADGLAPVAGMAVGLRSLADGTPQVVARDAAGQPVYTVTTDARGMYRIYRAADAAANVLVTAEVPGASDDRRLHYELVTPSHATASATLDEDTALVTRYLRRSYVANLVTILTSQDPQATVTLLTQTWTEAPEPVRLAILQLVTDLRDAAIASGLAKAPRVEVERVASTITDAALARLALDTLVVDPSQQPWYKGPAEPAIPALTDELRQLRQAAAAKLAADPHFFEAQPYLQAANQDRAPADAFRIARPSDLGEFVVEVYMGSLDPDAFPKAAKVYASVGLATDPATGELPSNRLLAVSDTVLIAIAQKLLVDQDGTRARALEVVKGYRPTASTASASP